MSPGRQVIALLWILLFSFTSHAHEEPGVEALQTIEKSQRTLETFGNPSPAAQDCPNCAYVDHPHEKRIACAQAICKDSKLDLQKIENNAVKNSPFVPSKEEAAKLAKIFGKWWQKRSDGNQLFLKALKETDLKVSPSMKRLLGFTKFFNGVEKVKFGDTIPLGRINILQPVDRDATKAAFSELDAGGRDAIVDMANLYFNVVNQESAQTQAYPLELILREKYPNMNRQQAFQREIEISRKLITEVKASPDFQKMSQALGAGNMDREVDLEAMAKVENPSDQQILEVIRVRSNFNLLKEVVDPNSAMSKLAIRMQDPAVLTEANRQKQLDVLTENEKFLKDPRNEDRSRSRFISRCLARLSFGVQVLPTEKELETARQNSEAAKADIEQKILPKFSKPTREKATPKIQDTRFVFPPSKDAFRRNFNDFLDGSETSIDSEAHTAGEFALAQALNPQVKMEDRLGNYTAKCDLFKNPMVSDASYGSNGAIQAGWGTTRDPKFGRFVMGHELGHRLADIFRQIELSGESKKRRDYMNSCFTMMHGMDGKPGEYLSEDWADWIGAEIAGNNGENPWCWRVDLAGLKDKTSSVSLFNESADDPHSSPFFRLIQIQRYSGRPMPPGCTQALLEQQPIMASPMKCTDPIPEMLPGQNYGMPAGTGMMMLPNTGFPPSPARQQNYKPSPQPVRPTN